MASMAFCRKAILPSFSLMLSEFCGAPEPVRHPSDACIHACISAHNTHQLGLGVEPREEAVGAQKLNKNVVQEAKRRAREQLGGERRAREHGPERRLRFGHQRVQIAHPLAREREREGDTREAVANCQRLFCPLFFIFPKII